MMILSISLSYHAFEWMKEFTGVFLRWSCVCVLLLLHATHLFVVLLFLIMQFEQKRNVQVGQRCFRCNKVNFSVQQWQRWGVIFNGEKIERGDSLGFCNWLWMPQLSPIFDSRINIMINYLNLFSIQSYDRKGGHFIGQK